MYRWFVIGLVACSYSPQATPGTTPGSDAADPTTDGDPVTADARECFGTGLVQLCLDPLPDTPLTLPGATNPIDTSVDGNCMQIVDQQGGDQLCVIAATTLTVDGSLRAIGKRPLVLVGTTSIDVTATGTVDVASNATQTGAGANFATICDDATFRAAKGDGDRGGGGGGAGGGFGTVGGIGGQGDNNDNFAPTPHLGVPGNPGAQQPLPVVLRGGCAGGAGGGGIADITSSGGAGGAGGGAVYLIAGESITITGNVFASGAGGRANAGSAGFEQGGGGGGSGGMIGIDAPAISIGGIVAANGGAGAGGGGTVGGAVGSPGSTINFDQRAAKGTGDTPASGGDGADGTCIGATTQQTPPTVDGGGGGGGGGLGVVWIDGTVTGGTKLSPAPTAH